MRRVLIIGFDRCQSLDLTGPLEVLAATDAYDVRIGSVGGGTFRTSSGLAIRADVDARFVRGSIDTLVVAGGQGTREAASDAPTLKAIARLANNSRRVASVCSGAFILAAAGLLDGRRATTHWRYTGMLAELFPTVDVEPDAIFVRDGNVWTSAGVTAGMDLALALVEDDLGSEVALTTARELVMFARRPGGQSQFSLQLTTAQPQSDGIRELKVWIADNVAADLQVATLAKRVGMSARNFTRVFRREVGLPPAKFVERARIETARRILETTPLGQAEIARASGFASADVFRRAFIRQLGVSPNDYRAHFSHRAKEQPWKS